jgi:hypothetical protein
LKANGYHHLNIKNLIRHRQLHAKENNNINQNKWAIFMYTGKETRFITKLFKEFNINISYRTRNTIGSILTKKSNNNQNDESGVYGIKCQNCPCIYIGQMGHSFKIRYKEHVQDIKNNKSRTGFSHHILNTGHAYDSIENTMEILNFQEKRQLSKHS